MREIIDKLKIQILAPKKEKLITEMSKIVLGNQNDFIPYRVNPQYYEIWFNLTFEFNYVFLGYRNFAIDISNKNDRDFIDKIYEDYSVDDIIASKFNKLAEFEFFIETWKEMERRVNKEVRCFFIEYGIIRGIDVNKQEKIDGEKIKEILTKENIQYP